MYPFETDAQSRPPDESGAVVAPGTPDVALGTISQIIGGWVDMMEHGHLPAVDLQDLRTVLMDDGGRCALGVGAASGPNRATTPTQRALEDLARALRG